MSAEHQLVPGAYARILDEELSELLDANEELLATLRKMDDEEQPQQYKARQNDGCSLEEPIDDG